ncbi:MAG: thiamine-phosphate kinase [Acidobacteriota bacterium]|nr:thiamine-phosphate kinase [Blastocatellia bacterium]MDW8412740.1 thiamine-phosphate kinase [Acidobacteriota bacterium]
MKEFEFISMLRSKQENCRDLVLGIGDDAAVFAVSENKRVVVTTDLLVEHIHFAKDYTTPWLLGRKSLSVNLSDIAAMGALPRFFLFDIALPKNWSDSVESFVEGLLSVAKEYDVRLIGGDTCASKRDLFIGITVIGECERGKFVARNGAGEGDLICVTGKLGASAYGLKLLKSGKRIQSAMADYERAAIKAHLDPVPRVWLGRALAEIATAMIDISDGLSSELVHICCESSVGCRLELDRLPVAEGATLEDALNGGEDYELLFTLPEQKLSCLDRLRSYGVELTVIGSITGTLDRKMIKNGEELQLLPGGYEHFS